MKRTLNILVGLLCCVMLHAQEFARMGEHTILGSARYIGMGGAMSAVGGDPSAVHDNPAALGLYRRAEVMLTFDESLDKARTEGNNYTAYKPVFSLPQASIALSMPTYNDTGRGIMFHNVLFSYQRLRTFNRDIYASNSKADASLGALLQPLNVEWDIPFCADPYNASSALQLYESGQVNEYAIDWSMNISDRWYVGAGIRFEHSTFMAEGDYVETFMTTNERDKYLSNRNKSTLILSGAGVAAGVGAILRPLGWLRLGVGLRTASLGALRYYTTGTLTALTDSLRNSFAPDMNYSTSAFHMPWHLSQSVAFQIGAYGIIALQYDYYHQKSEKDIHSLRAGFEVIPVLGFYINGGYAYESTFRDDRSIVPIDESFCRQDTHFQHPLGAHYGSLALGYRGTHVIVQAAYQYRCQAFRLWSHPAAEPFTVNTDTHKIVLTIAWHQYY